MRNGTEKNKKLAPILCAVFVAALMLFYIFTVVLSVFEEAMGDVAGWIAIGAFSAILLAIVVGVLLALKQRLREIDSGEEEDAKKY